MVSLAKFSSVSEDGVQFENPFIPGEFSLLKPEDSIRIQHHIGAVSFSISLCSTYLFLMFSYIIIGYYYATR